MVICFSIFYFNKSQPLKTLKMSYLLEKFRVACLLRGANGIVSIGKLFRIMDNDNDKKLSIQEFKEAMTRINI